LPGVSWAACVEALRVDKRRCFDFKVRKFQERFCEDHGIRSSNCRVKQALQGAGVEGRRQPFRFQRPGAS